MAWGIFNIEGYRCLQGKSTAGIIYNRGDSNPGFFNFYPIHNPAAGRLLPKGVPGPFTACSSSGGVLAVRHTATSTYFIGNPFSPAQGNYTALPPTPRPHHVDNTHVVLTISMVSPLIFHLICAVHRNPGFYDFDVYCSAFGRWFPWENINLEGHEIVRNSGVSCRRCAFWLTTGTVPLPRWVLRFDPSALYRDGISGLTIWPLRLREDVVLDHPRTRMQMGTIGKAHLLLAVVNGAAVNAPRVDLHLMLQNGRMPRFAFLNLAISQQVNWNNVSGRVFENDVLECRELPQPVRFESYKMEVPLLVDGRVVLWEEHHDEGWGLRRAVLLPGNAGLPVAADGFAHVRTATMPHHFPSNKLGEQRQRLLVLEQLN